MEPALIVSIAVGASGVVISLLALLKKYKVLSSFRWSAAAAAPPSPSIESKSDITLSP